MKSISIPRKHISLVLIAFLLITFGNCSSPAGATITKYAAAVQFRNDYIPVYNKIMTFTSATKKWNSHTSNSTVSKAADPLISGLLAFQKKLLNQSWPKNTQADIKTLIQTLSPMEGVLFTLSANASQLQYDWLTSFSSSFLTFASAVRTVEKDLGLVSPN